MPAPATSRFLHVTWFEIGDGTLHLVARCDLCRVVADRRTTERDEGILHVTAIEALAVEGCTHASDVAGTGARRALTRPKA